ncbi:MAG: hypothetical protein R6U32_03805 [Candidatus Woesearchaeota archaeon]
MRRIDAIDMIWVVRLFSAFENNVAKTYIRNPVWPIKNKLIHSPKKKRDKITLDLVEDADRNLERDQTLNVISTLTRHQKILYLVILKHPEKIVAGSDIYRMYLEECEAYNIKPLSERRVRSFLINFTEMGLIDSEVGWLESQKKKTRKIIVNLDKAVKNKAVKMLRDSI